LISAYGECMAKLRPHSGKKKKKRGEERRDKKRIGSIGSSPHHSKFRCSAKKKKEKKGGEEGEVSLDAVISHVARRAEPIPWLEKGGKKEKRGKER